MKNSRTKRYQSKEAILHARTFSTRSVCFGAMKYIGRCFRLSLTLAFLGAVCWGVWLGFDHAFLRNAEFQLRKIELNANPVISEKDLATLADIDPLNPPNLFTIDTKALNQKLLKISAIQSATISRKPPNTLSVKITPRKPAAWLATPNTPHEQIQTAGNSLLSNDGIVFLCPENMLSSSLELPIVFCPHLPAPSQEVNQEPDMRYALHLLDSCEQFAPDFLPLIHSIQQQNSWSLRVTLRDTTEATFGLGNHEDQFNRLRTALGHAADKHYSLATINLIPKYNVPITIRNEQSLNTTTPPPTPPTPERSRKSQDIKSLLNRTP